ncbi:probable isoaspartyl peptidase/L-asparaginase GA20639 [Nilaparvata lugens]|uniref:probable isoaspartyl peptidase/L-asparaginase GA20639 n=1 Tax=Nilaparvata lugens TaxID=108931 RepID=UPI00193E9AC7|nr:probable isoaspartyl peptidase/L-asparaginase GA20639 [Nilaparvata lugens]XP_022203963.2 probable isoaspartyl peptidase/L-asparaginase GA20639 [Nilaparvata lugens]XP_022203966.2 probable isoaspartyl peptidase/L-asparaginase GA20639 [Nilaparvata lugens]XP_039275482.1 probable isoaspartyl peptidase/L-asparaginase GA20639 [Nilaparvata lugens]XP_039275483.1 probable isoaspartyl peptidase/L-asparaginase GA20639 [Nilaparvata lugens]XP_039275484.1 probable isoaspartyl peptidase/L-asparaginase GA20
MMAANISYGADSKLPLLLVHGGAGDIPDSGVQKKLDGVRRAALEGHRVLEQGGCVLEGVVAAVKVMEDLEGFNAGRGSVLTLDGNVEMEAQIMEGANLDAGCVTLLTNVKNPIVVARSVMEKTPHTFLGGEGAQKFAKQTGAEFEGDDYFKTPAAVSALEKFKLAKSATPGRTEIGDTVGCVAVDCRGHTATATSTGGINGKYPGRIGDTPILGSGGYADDTLATVSTTGYGESIMRYNLAQRVLTAVACGKSAQQASEESVRGMTERVGNTAGVITLTPKGQVGVAFTSKRMAWAYLEGDKLHYGIEQGQHLVMDRADFNKV